MASMSDYKRSIAERDLRAAWPQWQIVRLLGTGAFGEVYEIQRSEYGRISRCALKILRKENDASAQVNSYANIRRSNTAEDFINTVLREIDIMERLKGAPNVVNIEDYVVVRNTDSCAVLIRMELLRNLDDYIISRGQITLSDVVKLGVDICNALEYCESQNIIHRDVKESNIFYSDMGIFKLGDFGISRQLAGYVMNNATMTSVGTISRMAPEVYRGDKYDGRADIYSLGIVLYCLLNYGRSPFYPPYPQNVSSEEAYAADMLRVKGTAVPPLQGVDQRLNAIITKACNAKPSGRYKSAAEFREALLSYYDEVLVKGEDPGRGESGDKMRRIAGAAAIAAIVLTAGTVIAFYGGSSKSHKKVQKTTYAYSDQESSQEETETETETEPEEESAGGSSTQEEEKHYLEPEESDEDTEEDDYYSGASGESIRNVAEYVKPSDSEGSAEEVSGTVVITNNDGKEIAYVEQPSWAATKEIDDSENPGVGYYSSGYDKYCKIYYTDSISAGTYIALVREELGGSGYELADEGTADYSGKDVTWICMNEVTENNPVRIYWGTISCGKGCISIAISVSPGGDYYDMTEGDFMSDVSCITFIE